MFVPTPAGFNCEECGKVTDNKDRLCDDCREE